MYKFKWCEPVVDVQYSRHSLTGVVNASLIRRTVRLCQRVVWRSNWIQFPNKQVVKLSYLLDGSQTNKLLQKL